MQEPLGPHRRRVVQRMSIAEAVVNRTGSRAPELMHQLEDRLLTLVSSHGEILTEQARTTIEAGGKRLRPLLVFLAADGQVDDDDNLVRAAVAIELIHSATLVHDDILDRAQLRRGRPTVVAKSGRKIAIATGDLLFSRAFAELTLNDSAAQVQALSAACASLVQGELIQRQDAFAPSLSRQRYIQRCRLKTASLFRAACELGALKAGSEDRLFGDFGEQIGIAFQLLDDVLDISGTPSHTGKLRGTDLRDGTITLPLVVARERNAELAALDLRKLRTGGDIDGACDAIAATGALDDVRTEAIGIVEAAKATLTVLPADQESALRSVADGVVDRYS